MLTGHFLMAREECATSGRIIYTPERGKLIKMVKPILPPGAKMSAIYKPLTVHVEIDKTGVPTNVKLIDGDPGVADAIVDAVKKWRWKPLKLNGIPVEVESTVVVRSHPPY